MGFIDVASTRLPSKSTATGGQVRERHWPRRDFLRRGFGYGGLGSDRLNRKCAERLLVGGQAQQSSATDRTTRWLW